MEFLICLLPLCTICVFDPKTIRLFSHRWRKRGEGGPVEPLPPHFYFRGGPGGRA